jgi:hypothetical protein
MSKLIRFQPLTALAITGMTVSLLATACGENNPLSDAAGALCCESFKVGADMSGADFGLEGDIQGQFRILAQATSDLSVVADGALIDVAVACENIARDMGADPADADAAAAKSGADAVKAWCDLASAQIEAKFGASGELKATLAIDFQPPVCTASVEASASCAGGCSANAECDVEATPPTCEGGKLSAMAAASCTGSCDAKCTGACSAKADVAVDCKGKCEGTCEAGGMTNGTGAQADGSCDGTCNGKCTFAADFEPPTCEGTCEGKCEGSCTAEAGVKFTCDAECMGDFEAPKCEGGELKLACDVDAECKANCEASASAKAECQPPSLAISYEVAGTLTADAQVQIEAGIASLKANLPNLLVVLQARGEAFTAGISGTVSAAGKLDVGELSGEAVFCLPPIIAAVGDASADFKAAFEASGSVVASVGVE